MSDAGEPHGTAGRPMLTVLLHSGVGEIVAVVTRYYGGTKLGTGGLVKAYSGSVKLALEALATHERIDAIEVHIVFGYASVAPVRQLLSELRATLVSQEQGAQVRYHVRLARTQLGHLRQDLANITRGAALVSEVD
jgi:putative IMPACT (imprinted ancient) family translation regulator